MQILKFLAGVNGDLNSELCDIGGDGKIGIEEAIFCLRAVAGLTESPDFNCSETSTPMTNMEDQKGQSHGGADKASVSEDVITSYSIHYTKLYDVFQRRRESRPQ